MAEPQQIVAELQNLRAKLNQTQAALQAERDLNAQTRATFATDPTIAALAAIPQALAGLQEAM